MFSPAGTVLPHIKAGKLRALATSEQQRLTDLPDVPTFVEAGIKGLDFSLWFGLNAPAGTPESVIAYLNKEVGIVLNLPDIKAQLIP
jgi:tripartite-type tricarboxylate transporter receptor subunit TctC